MAPRTGSVCVCAAQGLFEARLLEFRSKCMEQGPVKLKAGTLGPVAGLGSWSGAGTAQNTVRGKVGR